MTEPMADLRQFRLPDVGEGLTEAEIVAWKVKPGDTIRVNDVVVEIETAKSLVELPSPYAGVVTDLHAQEGETVEVGRPIISVDVAVSGAGAAASPAGGTVSEPAPDQPVEPGLIGGPAPGGRTSVLVGYGPRSVEARRRPRKPVAPVADRPAEPEPAPEPQPAPERGRVAVLAKPPVRKLAKDLGVDLSAVTPSGAGGTITRGDVETAATASAPAVAA